MKRSNLKVILLFVLAFSYFNSFAQSVTFLDVDEINRDFDSQVAVLKNSGNDVGYVIFYTDRDDASSPFKLFAKYYNLSNVQVGATATPLGGTIVSELDGSHDWELVSDNNKGLAASIEIGSGDSAGFYTVNTSTGAFTEVLNETSAVGSSDNNGWAKVGILQNGNVIFLYHNSTTETISFDIITPNTGAAVVSNTSVTTANSSNPNLTVLDDGGFFVTFYNTSSTEYKGQRYNLSGSAIGSEITIIDNPVARSEQALLSNGKLLFQQNGVGKIIDFSGAGTPTVESGEINFTAATVKSGNDYWLSSFENGGFVVMFIGASGASYQNLQYRIFDNNGNPATIGSIDITPKDLTRITKSPDITTFKDGGLLVSFGNDKGTSNSNDQIGIAIVKNMHPIVDLDSDNSSGGTGTAYTATTLNGQAGGVAITDTDVLVTDADGENITSIAITISNNLDGANEFLTLASATGITVSGSGTKTITLTNAGSAAKTNFQAALAAIRYENTSASNTTARSIVITVTDNTALTSSADNYCCRYGGFS